ncbi:MAG: dihydrolipoyllysine-residue succinyltransferase [Chloroflexi bacterium]|nr:dihydrolipoyllysine-residue succinyltransferase [Chloroflexota bacterium]|tara:strand:- start:1376 stop:2572 length:1197 start_codon:yes stop_codon:yes gene_type:complete
MTEEIKVPEMSESTVEATVGKWHKQVGDPVQEGDPLLELETDKVNLDVHSTVDGILTTLNKQTGDTVIEGQTLATISTEETSSKKSKNNSQWDQEEETTKESVDITPIAKTIAQKNNIDFSNIKGTGKDGKITKEDIENYLDNRNKSSKTIDPPISKKTDKLEPEKSLETRIKLSRRRLTIAKRLTEVQQETVMTTTFNEVDLSKIIEIRKNFQTKFLETHNVKLGFMSFFVKAVINSLIKFPEINSELQNEELILKKYYDIGIAVSTDEGLVVPVLRDALNKSFSEIEITIGELATRARKKLISLEELQGGTFTITNGGIFGSMMSTPILNPPQVGILGMHRIIERPMVKNNDIVIAPMMYLAVTYDHRVIDGSSAVQFLGHIKQLIEDPHALLINL